LIVDLVFIMQHGTSSSKVKNRRRKYLSPTNFHQWDFWKYLIEVGGTKALDNLATVSIDAVDIVLKEVTFPEPYLER